MGAEADCLVLRRLFPVWSFLSARIASAAFGAFLHSNAAALPINIHSENEARLESSTASFFTSPKLAEFQNGRLSFLGSEPLSRFRCFVTHVPN
jgi:hypothetical protein